MDNIRKQILGESDSRDDSVFRENEVVSILAKYLKEHGWKVKEQISVRSGSIDIGAEKDGRMLLIEVMQDTFFL